MAHTPEIDFDGDVCPRCRHVLHDGAFLLCGWRPERVEGPLPPHRRDGLPGIRGA